MSFYFDHLPPVVGFWPTYAASGIEFKPKGLDA
jgi:hypothetical protein